jgi:protein SCO1/2
MTRFRIAIATVALLGSLNGACRAQQIGSGTGVNGVAFEQKLGDQLPLGLHFRDDNGRDVVLGEFFGQKPVVLVPGYYGCPLLCSQVLNGLTRSFKGMTMVAGKDFEVVAFSINPQETPELAAKKKTNYLERFDRPGSEGGWHFLTGDQASIDALTGSLGFRYAYNPNNQQYTHAAGIVIATADGRLSRYFYGIDFPVRDVEHELKEAQKGRVGAPMRRLLLLCYDYDAATGRYTLSIVRLIRVLGSATALFLGGYVLLMFYRERHHGHPMGFVKAPVDTWDDGAGPRPDKMV